MTIAVVEARDEAADATGGNGSSFPASLLAFVLVSKFLGVPADAGQIAHEYGSPGAGYRLEDMARIAKRLKIVAKVKPVALAELHKVPLPALAELKDGEAIILLKVDERPDGTRFLIQRGDGERPEVWSVDDFDGQYAGRLLLMTTRELMAGAARPFDVSWFIPALVKYRGPLRDVLIGSFFLQLMGLISPIFFQLVIDKVLVHQSLTTLDVLAVGLSAVLIFETGLSALRNWLFAHTTNRVDSELSAQLFRHLLNLPLSYFEARRVGDSVARVRELDRIREFLTSNAVTVVIDLFFTIVFFGVMYAYSPLLTLIVTLSIPLYVAISVIVTPPLRARLDEKFRRGAENQSFLVESVTGIGTLKAMAVEPQMRAKWEKQFAGYTSTGFQVATLANWGSHLIQLVSKLTTVAILFFGAKAVITGDLSVGSLVAFNMLSGRVAQPILRLSQLWQDFQQVRISVDRLGDVLNSPAEPDHNPNRASLPPIKGAVNFDRVRFRYRPDAPEALRGISLAIQPGEMIGIVGPSGSGKSTLTKLVQRLYVPEQGRVLVDGVDLALVDPAWLRRQIGVVLQENILFNRSVRENIALADTTMPMERVIAAAQLAGAHEFILALSHGYDTVIDERGGNLSGGQRQRIAIARALIGNPRILILDEATSALDAESEEIIQHNLAGIARGRTVIIIAHRLSAVRQCDRIVTVEAGEITETGDHQTLLRSGGRYAQLYTKQMGRST
ncbi:MULTISPECIES: type I secretion system permease/ATPase [unclassified Bradyrhizobium]|uniref:type I secretion system permease/ATPase n=1 Tax=unclassified Bradyrhizobium TaxID=2631580 RepID=UPI00211E542E|nr:MULTISPECIES: type I secretion system permease/ATPase [unclassified Bradyrhizobium]MDD1535430.1 type I secretion system permease/ATPase [Bradyrhizobium sp. WBOS8]MDD1581959.1 type I secretion system permease/ATPase [Bradyrhizobium sp. WBOS4]UUO47454.1 type I secretion system permease/ATPase [Bradyrhizobium sp. WBOS04]UUO61070.1 type I secretion system permease/ATPase [Bradyrhizobium sp. WBOS08]